MAGSNRNNDDWSIMADRREHGQHRAALLGFGEVWFWLKFGFS
jgi:hypothetical protein